MRNQYALDQTQIAKVIQIWQFITETSIVLTFEHPEGAAINFRDVQINISEASLDCSNTRYSESTNTLFIGADVYPGDGTESDANSTMSVLACLCHELAHIERYRLGFRRPFSHEGIGSFIDEAETSLHASFRPELAARDRCDLALDAKQRINQFLESGRI